MSDPADSPSRKVPSGSERELAYADLEASLEGPYSGGSREVRLMIRSCVIERLQGERPRETIGRIDSMIVPAAGRR